MTLLWADGFDHYTLAQRIYKYPYTSAAGDSFVTGRFGGTAWRRIYEGNFFGFDTPSNHQTLVFGCALYSFSFLGPGYAAGGTFRVNDGATRQCTIAIQSDGSITAHRGVADGGTLLGTASVRMKPYQWEYLEAKFTVDNSAGVIEIRLNNTTILNLTSQDTQITANAYGNRVYLSGTQITCYHDDWYVLDDQGSQNNNFLGDVRVDTLWPSGAGNYAQWTPSAGNNYENVDDATPDDDSTYNDGDTNGDKDSFALDDLASPSGTVHAVQHVTYGKKTDAGGTGKYKPLYRISAADYNGNEITPGGSYWFETDIEELSPATASAWTVSEINGMEAGVERSA
jgi:archaellin